MIWVCFHPLISAGLVPTPLSATRILAAYFFLAQDSPSYPPVNFNAFHPLDEATNSHIDVQADDVDTLVRKIGAASTVLLKNVDGALPLTGKKKPRSLILVGSDAGPGIVGPNQYSDHVGLLSFLLVGCLGLIVSLL
jgi:beta-glucosidase-like glycosyl hydrolase